LTPGTGIIGVGKKSGSGSGMNNPDHISESLETIGLKYVPNFLEADPGSRIEKIRIRDGKNSDPGPATLVTRSGSNSICKTALLEWKKVKLKHHQMLFLNFFDFFMIRSQFKIMLKNNTK
jgi:hypothetical protein